MTDDTRPSSLAPAQTNHWQSGPSSLVFYLALRLAKTPTVHSVSLSRALPVPSTVEASDPLNIFQNNRLSVFESVCHYQFGCVVKDVLSAMMSSVAVL